MYDILLVIQTLVVLFLIGIILIQRSDSDGFGAGTGGGGNQFMTGRASANLLTRTTAMLATAFIIISLILASMSGHKGGKSIVDVVEQSAPEGAPLPAVDSAADGLSKLQEKTSAPAPAKPMSAPKPE
jgi:preprotein translocase subunit SecG